jgi:hypothetical protein
VLDTATEPSIVESVLGSIGRCALICAKFELCGVFDNLVINLCKRTLLSTQPVADTASVLGDDSGSLAEETAVGFTQSPKAQHVGSVNPSRSHMHASPCERMHASPCERMHASPCERMQALARCQQPF